MTGPLKIRAHHLLCMQGFQGYGYSDNFSRHLHRIVTQLRADSGQLIRVVAECDTVCQECPHCQEAQCRKDKDADFLMKKLDFAVLKEAGLAPNHIDKASHLFAQMNRTFQTRSQVEMICGNCQWTTKCTWYLALNN